ncbi:MAG: zinc ribbon domain-containing protein [Prevotella sp.]|nr:zinc ribbon domain-containing protein [Prevotella sp.]MDY4217512.1 zinc ribbon domain-containing protein [Prevotella sp.]
MKCPNCKKKVSNEQTTCPDCGFNLDNYRNDHPTLRLPMVIFIVIGTLLLVAYGTFYYLQHRHDPAYTQTAIDPDTTLADKINLKFDTLRVKSIVSDSTEENEKQQAEKVFKSIRNIERKNITTTVPEETSSSDVETAEPTAPTLSAESTE